MNNDQIKAALKARMRAAVAKTLAQPVTDYGAMLLDSSNSMTTKTTTPATVAVNMVRCLAAGKGDPHATLAKANKHLGAQHPVTQVFAKAIQAGDFTAGGALIPEEYSSDIIKLLRPRSVMRAINPNIVKANAGQLTIPAVTVDATSYYVGEGNRIPISQPAFGQKNYVLHKLATLVPLTNEAINFSSGVAEREVRDAMIKSMATKEDVTLLYSDGTLNRPTGLRHQIASSNVITTNGTSATNIESDFIELKNALDVANVYMERPCWLMHPTRFNHLLGLRDSNGNLIFPELRTASPTIHTFPVMTTTNISADLGGGSNESEIYLVEASEVDLAEAAGLRIEVSNHATYLDTTGNDVSTFETDQVLVRAITMHDLLLRHDVGAAVCQVAWGAIP